MRISKILAAVIICGVFVLGYASTAPSPQNPSLYAADAETGASPQHGGHQPPADEAKKFGNVRYFPAQHKIEFDAEINMRDSGGEPMELFACCPGGKTHESVVVADIVPSDLHAALLEAGLHTYPYPDRMAADRQDLLGSRAIVWMVWKEKDQEKRLRAEDAFVDTRLNRSVDRWGWAFVGQYGTVADEETGKPVRAYRPDIEKSLVTTYHSPNTVLDNPRSLGAFDDDYTSNTAAIPDVKTKVIIEIYPASEEQIASTNLKHDTELIALLKAKPEAAKELAIVEERVKWLETLVPLAQQVDAADKKIAQKIDPVIKAQTDKLAEVAKAGDKDAMGKLNTELEALYAQRDVALKELEKAYHYYYKAISEREAAEGKALGVDAKKQAILDGDVAFYNDKQENVENELALAKVRLEELNQKAALAATDDAAKQLEIKIRLAELTRDGKILESKITTFHLKPEIESVNAYIAAAEKNLAEAKAKGDDELAASYQKELDAHKARLEYLNNKIEACTLRQQIAQLECNVAVGKLKGEEPPVDVLKQLQELDKKASILEMRAQIYELSRELKQVSDDLDIEIQTGGDHDLIVDMQKRKKEIEDKIAALKYLINAAQPNE